MLRDVIGLLIIAALGAWGGWELSARYGHAARQLVKWNTEIAATNKRLQQFEAEERRAQIAAEDKATAEDSAFAKELPSLGKCTLSQAQVTALNKIGGE